MPGLRDILEAATPQPWEPILDPNDEERAWILSPLEGTPTYITPMPGHHDQGMIDADARLAALAPELAALVLDMGERMRQFEKAGEITEFGQTRTMSYAVLAEIFAPLLARLDQLGKDQT